MMRTIKGRPFIMRFSESKITTPVLGWRQGCRCKMRMSGLCKVEMSAFMGGRGAYGNGADRLEPTRTGPIARATRGQAEADHADRSRQAAEDQRSPYPLASVSSGGTRRPSGDPWITRTKIKPQVSCAVGAENFAPGATTLCGLRTHPGRRALGPGGVVGEPRNAAQVDGEDQLMVPARATRKDHPCVAGTASQFRGAGDAG